MTERIDLGLNATTAEGCACCATSAPSDTSAESSSTQSATVSQTVLVSGMTCSHCVSSVTKEIMGLDGVTSVEVSLNANGASQVTINGTQLLDADAVQAAVEEAGYSLAKIAA